MKTIRNDGDRSGLLARIEKLTGDETAQWGKMNVNQMVSHLVQVGTFPFEATLENQSNFASRNLIKPLVLYVLPIPKEVKTMPDLDQQENGRKPGAFDEDKRLLAESINKCGEIPADENCSYHPFFGPMTAKQWGMLAHKHIDHHLRQFGV
jgi:hypothetical protein